MQGGETRSIPVSVKNGEYNQVMGMSAAVSTREAMRAKAEKEGATIIEVPLPDAPGATRHGGITAEALGAMAKALADEADALRAKHPDIRDDSIIRAMIVTSGGDSVTKFVRKYPAIFHTFTDRGTIGETRGRMLQVIKLKMQLERKAISPEESHSLLADLFGVNAQQRAELRENLAKMAKESEKK